MEEDSESFETGNELLQTPKTEPVSADPDLQPMETEPKIELQPASPEPESKVQPVKSEPVSDLNSMESEKGPQTRNLGRNPKAFGSEALEGEDTDGNEIFSCPECSLEFNHEGKFRAHLEHHKQGNRVFSCTFCLKMFASSSNLNSHMRTHTGQKPYRCMKCQRLFPRMNNLRGHILKMHDVKRHEVDSFIEKLPPTELEAQSKTENKLPEIKTSPSQKVPSPQKVPSLTPSTEVKVKEENEIKDIEDASAENDSEGFFMKTQSVPSASADTCEKGITFVCKICSKESSSRSNMVQHVRTHLGAKLFKCMLCVKSLARKQNLIHHLRYVHYVDADCVDNVLQHCKYNGEVDDSANTPAKRKLIMESLEAEMDNSEYADRNHSMDDINNAVPDEDSSDMKFVEPKMSPGQDVEPDNLPYEIINKDSKDERQYRCKLCGFSCDRKYYMTHLHMLKHTGNKPYMCVICSKPYTRKYVLRNHIMKEHQLQGKELLKIIQASDLKKSAGLQMGFHHGANGNTIDFGWESSNDTSVDQDSSQMLHAVQNDKNDSLASLNDTMENVPDNDITSETSEDDEEEESLLAEDQRYRKNKLVPEGDFSYSVIEVSKDGSKETAYKCNICNFTCTRKYYMIGMHKLSHTGNKPYLCVICCKSYSRKFVLRKHIVKEHKILGEELEKIMEETGQRLESYNPDQSNVSLASDSGLNMTLDHDQNCNDGVNQSAKRLKLSQDEQSAESCTDNTEEMATDKDDNALNESLNVNLSEKHTNLNFWHGIGGRKGRGPGLSPAEKEKIDSFIDKSSLSCLQCSKKCSNLSNLRQHVRILHFNMKEYLCHICDRSFNTSYNLKVHMKQHLDVEDRKKVSATCPVCNNLFTSKSYLKIHLTSLHQMTVDEANTYLSTMKESGCVNGNIEDIDAFTQALKSLENPADSGVKISVGDENIMAADGQNADNFDVQSLINNALKNA
ncbi:zinc finger protein 236-like isoform X2 [Dreissena polymorpha]|uniref:C2H2-type domain-containing protein n=1 Tax=Dreissena polymorpha TaxID=45954 RepID=A0A9D4S8Z1_DREPO|nr:zinc finger protein 236-like isoform X1 [Dreissena polymorpha]XP_052256805.1 zinc finger protein 236-like isoform X2 [Dreissena polymorpha]KAH3894107.1 hypothetical protein DPMN_018265 [Dreissena polymorpha]